jgi:hypothetical protein
LRKVRLQGCNASLVRGKGGILVRLVGDYRLLLLNGWVKMPLSVIKIKL